jgi:large subunit ribosomal protein L13
VSNSFMAKAEEQRPQWYVIDATVGRLATRIATVLRGKHKPTYTPHVDCGDFVVVVNADKVRFTGRSVTHPVHDDFTSKMLKKEYDYYTGYTGGRKVRTAAQLMDTRPEEILRLAVRRMVPKKSLGRKMMKKLRLFAGPEHTHQAQQPEPWPEYLKS